MPIRPAAAADDGALVGTLVTVPETLTLKVAIGLRERGAAGLVVVGAEGQMLGTACEADLFRALLCH